MSLSTKSRVCEVLIERIYVVIQENAYLWRTSLYLAASASAEFFADIALCPMEAVKVRIQTQPGFATTLREGAPKILHGEGWWGYVQAELWSIVCSAIQQMAFKAVN